MSKYLFRQFAVLILFSQIGCALRTRNVVQMPPFGTEADGKIIMAISEYVRDGNMEQWPYIKRYEVNPIICTMTAGEMTETIVADALYHSEKIFSLRFSSVFIQELKSRNTDHVSLKEIIPGGDHMVITSDFVVKPPLMDTWDHWGNHGYLSVFLPVYFNNGTNAILVAWAGPSLNGGIATFLMEKKNNKWQVVKSNVSWFM